MLYCGMRWLNLKKISKRKKRITKLYNNRSNPFKYSRIFYIVYSL